MFRRDPLTKVTDGHVGQARQADPPYQASAWERQISLVNEPPPWISAGMLLEGGPLPQMDDEPAAMRRPAAPSPYIAAVLRGGPPITGTRPTPSPPQDEQVATLAPPVPPASADSPAAPDGSAGPGWPGDFAGPATESPTAQGPAVQHPGPQRRRTLGESRRLGLGSPIRAAGPDEGGPASCGGPGGVVRASRALAGTDPAIQEQISPGPAAHGERRLGLGPPISGRPSSATPGTPGPAFPQEAAGLLPSMSPPDDGAPPDTTPTPLPGTTTSQVVAVRTGGEPSGPDRTALARPGQSAASQPTAAPPAGSCDLSPGHMPPHMPAPAPAPAPAPRAARGTARPRATGGLSPTGESQPQSGPASLPTAGRTPGPASRGGRPVTARPTALGGLIYRSTWPGGPVPPASEDTGPPPSGVRTQLVPAEVAGPFGVLTGLDVTGIPVHRGPAVSEQARAYQARAFTRSGEIFLPDEAGPIEHSDTRALLAHELTHVIQQRILAPALPDETSAHGQELESEASHAEQWFRSGGTAPPRLAHLPVATLLAGHAGVPAGAPSALASTVRTPWSSPIIDSGPAGPNGVQRQPGDLLSAGLSAALGGQSQAEAPGSAGLVWPEPDETPDADSIDARPGAHDLRVVTDLRAAASTVPQPAQDELAELIGNVARLTELSAMRPADLEDPTSLDELTSKVYPRLRGMLRAELLIDRERAGLLADFS